MKKSLAQKDEVRRACEACGCSHHDGHHGCGYMIERVHIECDGCCCWSCNLFQSVAAVVDDWPARIRVKTASFV